MVFVLNKNKKPLAPCSNAKARKLLKNNKAIIHKQYPFTIRLKNLKIVTEESRNEYSLKIDYGSKYTGMAILNEDRVIWLGEIKHRDSITISMKNRSMYRRRRRSKNLRYRAPRFLNRRGTQLPPTLNSRVGNIENWIIKLRKVVPLTKIIYEDAVFNTSLMSNPEVSGIEYQQGTLKGYNIREFLLEHYNRTCMYCKKQNTRLEIEHIIPKSRGGSNQLSNLGIACSNCNREKGSLTAQEYGFDISPAEKRTLRDPAIINSTKNQIKKLITEQDLECEFSSGATTKMNRIALGLPKTHYYDACCVGESTPKKLFFCTDKVLNIGALGRGRYQRVLLDKYGFPRAHSSRTKLHFGFQTGDIVIAKVPKGKNRGVWKGSVSCRKTGSFNINLVKGRIEGVGYKYMRTIQKSDGYKYTETAR